MATPFIGEIQIFSFSYPPKGWALCNGQLLSINTNQALFSILGTTYGGNGIQTFGLPNVQGRSPVHWGSNYVLGEVTGTEQVTVLLSNLPQHNHPVNATSTAGTRRPAVGGIFASDSTTPSDFYAAPDAHDTTINPLAMLATGGNQPHNNMQPFLTTNFCIALTGIFPSRN